MSFSTWTTTRRPLSLGELGEALAEVAPRIRVLFVPATDGEDISVLGQTRFGLVIGDDIGDDCVEVAVEIYAEPEDDRVRIGVSMGSSDFGGMALALVLGAAALSVAGGRYGDEAE